MKPYEKFAKYLGVLVEDAGLHKNEMIRNLGIDRSTYFQILRGDRLPTREQYQRLRRSLLLPKKEEDQLDDLYFRMVLGEDISDDIGHVWDLIRFLSEIEQDTVSENGVLETSLEKLAKADVKPDVWESTRMLAGRQEVEVGIGKVLYEALSSAGLDFYMPSAADAFFGHLKQFLQLCRNELQVRQIVTFPGGRIGDKTEVAGILEKLLIFLSAGTNLHYACSYYYHAIDRDSDIGLLYPWYVICDNCILMVSADFRSALYSENETVIRAYRERFEQAFQEGTPLIRNYGALEQNLRAIKDFLQGNEVNYEAIPCIAMIATPENIRKYVIPEAQELLIAHCTAMQQDEHMTDYASFSGVRRFFETGLIPEIPSAFMRPVDQEYYLVYLDILLERLGDTLFMIDESKIPAVHDWDITIVEEASVLIHRHNFDTIILDEKNIVDMFTAFARNLPQTAYIMDTEKARKELLDLRAEVMMELKQKEAMTEG